MRNAKSEILDQVRTYHRNTEGAEFIPDVTPVAARRPTAVKEHVAAVSRRGST